MYNIHIYDVMMCVCSCDPKLQPNTISAHVRGPELLATRLLISKRRVKPLAETAMLASFPLA